MTARPWEEIAAEKKKEQESRIPNEWKIPSNALPPPGTRDLRPWAQKSDLLSARELEITDEKYDTTSLASAIATGMYSAEEVTTAFCKRAAIAQQLTNCLTEICFLEAIKAARELDAEFEETGKPRGPLHGVPMTLKECFHVKGVDASDGYISRCFAPSTYDSYLTQILRSAGALIIAKTNNPQTMLVAESHNNVFGRALNPVVSHLTCGGSSGGEGSIQAFRGSSLGVGTDVGGSIRIPAAANGIYGFKPSYGMLPLLGYANSNWLGLNTGIPAVCGPMGHSVRDMQLFMRAVRDQKPWLVDPAVIPFVYEAGTVCRKPVIGVIHSNGIIPHPPILRGIAEAADKLKGAGFKVKEFHAPFTFAKVREVSEQLFTIDGLSYAREQFNISAEPPVPSVIDIGFWDLPRKTPEEQWAWNAKKIDMQKQMLDAWETQGIDVMLCPAGPHTAVEPGKWTNDMYTVWVNAMDYPAVVIPIGVAEPEKDPVADGLVFSSTADEANQAMYEPSKMAGAPIALQIVGKRLSDEQLLVDVGVIEEALKG
ncbi:amidase [Trematosphaeria pertusa]|uniref:Amidase n=1 Tax=Trematosphaeria pertusa TaxID=390896 RepID=A0A6A6HWQ7_9PLEO|nr:amidase [Trematosphaeria pertusa]KAF2242516.1 amidase [Trematosphaeria pertusa]